MKVYTGTFTATANTSIQKNFQMQPGDYPVIAQFFPVPPSGSFDGLYFTGNSFNPDAWTGVNSFSVGYENTTSSDIQVSYVILVTDTPTVYIPYAGA
jgi:hypothetical protein